MGILDKPVLRQRDVMELIGVSRPTLQSWRRDGAFPEATHRLGKQLLGWDTAVVVAWIEAQRVTA